MHKSDWKTTLFYWLIDTFQVTLNTDTHTHAHKHTHMHVYIQTHAHTHVHTHWPLTLPMCVCFTIDYISLWYKPATNLMLDDVKWT